MESEALNLISNVGFPIAAFLLMYFFATKTLKENTNAIRELSTIIKAKMS